MIIGIAESISIGLDIKWMHSYGVQRDKKLACKYTQGETPVVGRGIMDGGVMGESREEAIKVEDRE